MADAYHLRQYGSLGLMIIGVVALTVGADVAPDPSVSALFAIAGGIVVAAAGVWSFRISEKRRDFDERYLEIGLRGAAISLWVFFWAVSVWAALERSTDITTPVLEPLTWLMLVPFVVLPSTVWYYERVM